MNDKSVFTRKDEDSIKMEEIKTYLKLEHKTMFSQKEYTTSRRAF